MGGGGTGGGGGGGGPPDEAGITAAPLGWPGGRAGPEMQRRRITCEEPSPTACTRRHERYSQAVTWWHNKRAMPGSTKHPEE